MTSRSNINNATEFINSIEELYPNLFDVVDINWKPWDYASLRSFIQLYCSKGFDTGCLKLNSSQLLHAYKNKLSSDISQRLPFVDTFEYSTDTSDVFASKCKQFDVCF